MKNVFRGLSAKLALALLAVGTMTSCYEKEELDKTPASTPDPAKYYIQGNVLDVENGQPLKATVKVNGAAVEVSDNGYYRTEVAADQNITIEADMDNYFTATKTAYLPKTDAGSVSIATVDFALVGVNSQITAPEYNTRANEDQTKQVVKASDLNGLFAGAGYTLADDAIEVGANGDVVVTIAKSVEAEVADDQKSGNYTFNVPLMSGFSSTVSPNTKALTADDIWLASAGKALGMSYGMQLVKDQKHTFNGVKGAAISTLTIKAYYKARALAFNGKEGVVLYQEMVRATVTYEDHDSHDGHDYHDVHDSHDFINPEAGGGSGK